MRNLPYALKILEAYEDEVAGAAYFDALGLAYPERAAFFEKCAAGERETANQLIVLLRKYQLTPQPQTALEERGANDALGDADGDWLALLRRSITSYAHYVEEFKALEAVGPSEDQPILAALTAHEIRLIEWMRAETATKAG
jgi:hypothetical protein